MRSFREAAKNANAQGYEIDEQTKAEWEGYLSGLGLTQDEYWQNEEVIKGYQAGLSIGRLRSALAKEWGFTSSDLCNPDALSDFNVNGNSECPTFGEVKFPT